MQYTLDIDIAAPREVVVALFDNPENMSKWQEALVGYELLEGVQGQEGAKTRLINKFGKNEIEMLETVEKRNLPDEFIATYEAKGAWNRVVNRFVEVDADTTKWVFDSEFKCTGFLRVMAFLMPGMFKKASFKDMERFKAFVESC